MPLWRSSGLLATLLLLGSLLLTALPASTAERSPPPKLASVFDVPPGGDLQAVLDAANPGDTIRLAAGATYTGWFTLPAKTGEAVITIRTNTSDSDLPPPGRRINATDAPLLARVDANAGGSVFTAAPGAHGYRFLGLEIAPTPGTYLYNVVLLGDGLETSIDQLPRDIAFERCYIHGDPVLGSRRGIALNARNVTVVDSWISDFKEVGADSQALAGWGGAGPFTIVNNYLEGAGENIIFGGADANIPDLIPSDIVVRHNHFFKPLRWRVGDPTYEGTHWSVKNLFELKVGRRVLVEGNVFEQNWVDAQVGTAILFTVRNQDGGSPWSQIDHVTFRDNLVRHAGDGFSVLGYDNNYPSRQTNNVTIANNLLYDLNTTWGGWGAFALVLNGTDAVTIDHNTVLQGGHVLIADGAYPNTGFVFTNNISPHNEYGVFGSGRASGNSSLAAYWPGAVFRRNVIPGAPAASYPTDNFYPANLSDVKFADLPGGDYRLAGASPYKGKATDGTDVGADIDAVERATCGAINGTYCPSAPAPNRAPLTPTITGPSSGTVGQALSFTVQASDPDNDSVQYTVDWGDGTETVGAFVVSGSPSAFPHAWGTKGTFIVRARAVDPQGATSGLSTPLSVVVSETGPPTTPVGANGALILFLIGLAAIVLLVLFLVFIRRRKRRASEPWSTERRPPPKP